MTNFTRKRVTISFEVMVGVEGETLAPDETWRERAYDTLNDYCDGRRVFSVEMMRDGLTRLLQNSLESAVDVRSWRVCPNRMTEGGTHYACVVSEMKMRRLKTLGLTGETTIQIENMSEGQ